MSYQSRTDLRRRHRAGEPASRTRVLAPVAAVVAALVLVTGAGAAWSQGSLSTALGGSANCAEVTGLVIVADTSVAPALTTVAKDFDRQDGNCTKTEVRAQESGSTAALLASNALGAVDAWVPDSTVWLHRTASTAASLGRAVPELREGESIASTPVVFAAPAARATEFAAQPVGWSTLLVGGVGALFPDPEVSSASLAGLLSLSENASTTDTRQLAGAMLELGKSIPDSATTAFSSALSAERPTVVVTTEREIAVHNAAIPEVPLVAIYPSDGTKALTYPFVRLPGSAKSAQESEERTALLTDFATAARSASTVFAAEGFRNSDGAGELQASGVLTGPPLATPAIDGAAQVAVLDSWSVLTRRSRMLVAVDVSGSMLEPAGGGLRRIDVYQRAAVGALGKFSGDVHMGMWVFSTTRANGLDYEEVVPIGPLSDPVQTQLIIENTTTLPSRIRGDTGLYDTVLAAVSRVREAYNPAMVNSVLIITDGKNDDKGSIALADLLTKLSEMNDPLKPVPVILIGFGPDTDLASMEQIAKTTGGSAYSAYESQDLGLVFVDALSQRTCRPNC